MCGKHCTQYKLLLNAYSISKYLNCCLLEQIAETDQNKSKTHIKYHQSVFIVQLLDTVLMYMAEALQLPNVLIVCYKCSNRLFRFQRCVNIGSWCEVQ